MERVVLFLLCAVAASSAWGTFVQFGVGLTIVTSEILLIVPFLLFAFLSGRARAYGEQLDVLPFGVLAICLASIAWTVRPDVWAINVFWYTLCVVLYLSTRLFVRTPHTMSLLALSAAVGGIVAVLQMSVSFNSWGVATDRYTIEGTNANFIAYTITGSTYLLFATLGIHVRRPLATVVLWSFVALSFYSTAMLGTRGAFISLAAMCSWHLLANFGFWKQSRVLSFVTLIFCLAITFGFLDWITPFLEQWFDRQTGDLAGRGTTWAVARQVILENPFFGVGPGSFRFLNEYDIGAHNIFLTLLLDFGPLGFLLMSGFLLGGLAPAFANVANRNQFHLLGLFSCYFLPIGSSGHIEQAPMFWLSLGVTFTLMRYGLPVRR